MKKVTNLTFNDTMWLTTEDGSEYDMFIDESSGTPQLKLLPRSDGSSRRACSPDSSPRSSHED